MSKITTETIKHLADLAKLELSAEEISKYTDQIASILEYVEKINEVDTDKIDYKSHVELTNVLRDDQIEKSLDQKTAINQAKNKAGYIILPQVLEDE